MRIAPASSSPFLPYAPPGSGPVFPAGAQPLIYLHHQYGFAADGSEWTSRIGAFKATQSNVAKRPTVTAGGLYSDGTKSMQTEVLPLSAAPALTIMLTLDFPLNVSGILIEGGIDYHNSGAFGFLAEANGTIYAAYTNAQERAERAARNVVDTMVMRLQPPADNNPLSFTMQSLALGYGSTYYQTGVQPYGLADNVLNLFARNNGAGPVGLSIRQLLIFPAILTEAKVAEWMATF